MKQVTQTLNDGVLSIYSLENIAEKGNKPIESLKEKEKGMRYEERTVGMARYWTAFQYQTKIQRILRVQRRDTIQPLNVVVPNDGEQYKIVQVQYPKDSPSCMDLSLERLEARYDITRS